MFVHAAIVGAQNPPESQVNAENGNGPPEIVRVEKQSADDDARYAIVGNDKGYYWLVCKAKAEGCIGLEASRNYLLFNSRTRWKLTGAKEPMTLSFIQESTSKYEKGESIGLVPEDLQGNMGMFVLDTLGAGYQPNSVIFDGPIQYGTGLNDENRRSVWKYLFEKMVEVVAKQQGMGALATKLAKRCPSGKSFCVVTLDADFVGIGRSPEPRKVVMIFVVESNDFKTHPLTAVCIKFNDRQVCRDWDTGKVMLDYNEP
jgi:hypothetical protein